MNLKSKTAIALFFITIACSATITSITYTTTNGFSSFNTLQDIDNSQRLTFSIPLVLGISLQNNAITLSQPTRLEIYTFVKNNPGTHFRGICNNLDLPIGVVQYHLNVLIQAGLIAAYNDGQNKRFFESQIFKHSDAKLISLLRHETTRRILTTLSDSNEAIVHKELAFILGLSSQALTWQMNQLKKTGLIDTEKENLCVRYTLKEEVIGEIKLLLDMTNKL